ncbi:MAG TPA: lamin tail domain-containing protein [Candidatus Paceibacterota bacterium]|nr:lamin tail domain-containing protein [Candidatus Paceibacterota bacterium]
MKGSETLGKCLPKRLSVLSATAISSAVFFLLPAFASAQVVINEIMYNPQGSNTGREWIELYNQGSTDVTMVGGSASKTWRVQDGSGNNALHTLTDPSGGTGRGSLVVPAGGYLIIASDPTEFISGEYAGGVYSAVKSAISLSSTGASISLIDQTSGTAVTIDKVTYTNAQGGSDDGTSLQRQSDGSWIAAIPTPGSSNSSVAYVAPADTGGSGSQTDASSTTQTSGASTVTTVPSYVAPPTPNLFASAGPDRTVIVGADSQFDGSGYDKNQNALDPSSTRFSWNFGDGTTAEGASVLHHFDYPGRYAVVLSIANGVSSAADTMQVIAEPAALSFSALADGGVAIRNLAGHDLDLSGWVVKAEAGMFSKTFVLPPHSEVLAGQTMQIGSETLQFRSGPNSSLEYPNGVVALGVGGTTTAAPLAVAPVATSTATASQIVEAPLATTSDASADDTKAQTPEAIDNGATQSETGTASASSTQLAAAGGLHLSLPGGKMWWWIGAIALALIGGGALIVSRGAAKHEWDIIEQKD